VGEQSRAIYPAGLLTRTLADAVGPEAATDLYLTDDKLTATQACERGLVQAVAPSADSAQRLVHDLARRYATTAGMANGALREELRALSGELPPSERRILAVDAFAQARSMLARASGSANAKARAVVFTSSGSALTRGRLRRVVQGALSSDVPRGDEHEHALEWRTMSYAPEQTEPKGAAGDNTLQQLQKLLARALVDQPPSSRVHPDAAEVVTDAEPPVAKVTPLAASFAAALAAQPDANPLDALLQAHDELPAESSSSSNVQPDLDPLASGCPLSAATLALNWTETILRRPLNTSGPSHPWLTRSTRACYFSAEPRQP